MSTQTNNPTSSHSSPLTSTSYDLNAKKAILCPALNSLREANNISLSALTDLLTRSNVTLDDALSVLNVTFAEVSTMSVAQIIQKVTAACQGYISVSTLRTRGTTNIVSEVTNAASNNNTASRRYRTGITRSYYGNGSYGQHDYGDGDTVIIPIHSRRDRDSDYSDYWYDGTHYEYHHRIWRWVLLGVFCALLVATAFALLCFACYRPYQPTTTTVVTPLPVTEKIYTSNGQVDVPPLPISPMPAYSNAATLRV